jgi:UDP-N-acetylglucosamine 2-epimerase
MINIVAIAGVRPQFIKLAALQDEVKIYNLKHGEKIHLISINAAQHYDPGLSDTIVDELGVYFDYLLEHTNREPIQILGNMIIGLYNILENIKDTLDWVIIFGDANPTLAGAIAASRLNLPIVHIEAGMRRDLYEHEEINRQIADKLATINFCVSKDAVGCLTKEGITKNVYWTGDLAYNFMSRYAERVKPGINGFSEGYILSSIHRPQNLVDNGLSILFEALAQQLRQTFFLTHPRTQNRIKELGLVKPPNVNYLEPLNYQHLLAAIRGCAYILTDSGGIIREGYHFGKRTILMRDNGGWSELVDRGFNKRITKGIESIRDGLSWAENHLNSQFSVSENVLFRENANEYMLNMLIEHTQHS